LHLFCIAAICARETIWALAQGPSIFPPSFDPIWKKTDQVAAAIFGEKLPLSQPTRQVTTGYEHLAGVESGYGFFAPNVTDSSELLFELHYSDGRIEYDLPSVGSNAAGIRLATLLDKIRLTEDSDLRETMIKMLTHANWQEHREANLIRAIFGQVVLPGVDQFERGERERFDVLYTYDFVARASQDRPSQ